jgi:rRNA processing protein Krr1/Pno1
MATTLADAAGQDSMVPLEAEFFMEQRLVGWIIGRGGTTLKEVENTYGVKVSLDQASKEAGYSKVRISGGASLVQQAAEHMNTSLARAVVGRNEGGDMTAIGPFLMDSPPGPGPEMVEELHIEQRFVGWLLGKSGAVIREIEGTSGCKISMNQATRNMGYTIAQLHGNPQQRAAARQLMEASLERAASQDTSGGHGNPPVQVAQQAAAAAAAAQAQAAAQAAAAQAQAVAQAALLPPTVGEEDLQVEQQWVGWLLGRGGGFAKEIENETGTKITIDQSTKSLGWSTVKIVGDPPQVQAAKHRIAASLAKAVA